MSTRAMRWAICARAAVLLLLGVVVAGCAVHDDDGGRIAGDLDGFLLANQSNGIGTPGAVAQHAAAQARDIGHALQM